MAKVTVNELMELAAKGDPAAINVLDMIDGDENGARRASEERLGDWYWAGHAVFFCPLCGQRIDDGKPCGCGARR